MFKNIVLKFKQHRFLFEELVKRDFTRKYRRTVLGILWSVIGPLATLGIMAVVFTQFFGRDIPHYVIYMFCGNLLYSFFKESTLTGMTALVDNVGIFSKVNVPKYMFLLSKNVSATINFGINIIILFIFAAFDGIAFSWKFIFLIYPIVFLLMFNIGAGLILSASYIMFRDVKYLYDIFTLLLMYLSAIFYAIEAYPEQMQKLFYLNPIFVYIKYFRSIIIDNDIPSLAVHLLAAGYAIVIFIIGAVTYVKKNYKFLYYI